MWLLDCQIAVEVEAEIVFSWLEKLVKYCVFSSHSAEGQTTDRQWIIYQVFRLTNLQWVCITTHLLSLPLSYARSERLKLSKVELYMFLWKHIPVPMFYHYYIRCTVSQTIMYSLHTQKIWRCTCLYPRHWDTARKHILIRFIIKSK